MKKIALLTLTLIAFSLTVVFAQKGYINPAANYAQFMGYNYHIVMDDQGNQKGEVVLPNGDKVDAWEFYKGKVGNEYQYGARYGFDTETETIKHPDFVEERAVCITVEKGEEIRIPMLELMSINNEPLVNETNNNEDAYRPETYDPNFEVNKSLPSSFDWRDVNGKAYIDGVRNQGGCGSCYAFGATAAAEGTYNYATNNYDGNCADFSESWIAWCLSTYPAYSSHFSGCNGADYDYQELQALCDVGHIDESYFPYTDSDNQNCPSSTDAAPKTKFENWYRVTCNDVDAIKTAIMTYGVVDAAVYVTTSFQNYSGGVFTDSYTTCSSNPCYNTPTNHAIALVGWGYDAIYGDYWILRNSWGPTWGENGYMRIDASAARVGCSVCYMVYDNIPQPPVADFSADATTIVAGNTVNFADNSLNSPTSWSWTFEGGSPSASTAQNPSVTYNTLGTYSVTLIATNAEGSDTETKTAYINVVDEIINYCTSAGANYSYEWIGGVQVGDFSNTSGASGYTDFTNLTANLTAGQTYNITLTPDFSGSTYNEYWKIWIDLNRDGDFDDAEENVFDQGGMSSTTVTGTITIPSGTESTTTRMRVTMKYNGEPSACETSFSYGEVEDYTVNITGGTSDTEAPTVPTGLSASSVTISSFTLSWNASTDNVGVTGYDVYQNGGYIGTTASTSYNVTGLSDNTTYSMTVKAKDAAANVSAASNALNVTTLEDIDTQAPTVPTGLASSNITQTSFTLSWNSSSDNVGVTGYDVYRNGSYLGTTASTSYNVSGLSASTTYSMTVKAKDAAGNVSAASNALNVTTLDPPDTQAPTAPTNLAVTNETETSISLSWSASTDNVGVTGYDLYMDGAFEGSTTSTNYTATGLSPATTYSFYVKAKDAAGNISSASNTVNGTTLEGQISYCSSQGNNSSYEWIAQVEIGSFTNSSGAAGYTDFTSQTVNASTGNTSITLTPGFSGSTYQEYWRIWIDLNVDGDFDDADEMVFDQGGMSSSAVSGTMYIPSSAEGTVTRMRVTMKYNGAPTACETFSYGEVEDYTVSILGGAANVAPVADANGPYSGTEGIAVSFSSSGSYDTDGSIVSYYWEFGDGGTSTSANPSHTYATAGTYDVTLIVTDDGGLTDEDATTATITSGGGSGPVELAFDGFESGWGNWTDGGGDCSMYTSGTRAWEGSNAVNIQDNSGTSSSTYLTNGIDVHTPGYTEIQVEFYFYAYSMEYNEDFWVQYYNGSTWYTVASYARGTNFENMTFYVATVTISENDYTFPTNMKIRFMCDASGNADDVYIDNITITGENKGFSKTASGNTLTELYSLEEDLNTEISLNLYPNPAINNINIQTNVNETVKVMIVDMLGNTVQAIDIENNTEIDISQLPKGMYFVILSDSKKMISKRFIKQ